MVSKVNDKDNPLKASKTNTFRSRYPTLAQCKRATGGGNAKATVLHKLCLYYSKATFPIDGELFTAPTTAMLVNELGLARSTIQKAISDLEDAYIIQVKHRHWRRSQRRYIRVLINPLNVDDETYTSFGVAKSGDACTDEEALSQSDTGTVHIEKKKKKKIQKKTQPIQEKPSSTLEATPNYDPPKYSQDEFCKALAKQTEDTDPTTAAVPEVKLWQPRGIFEKQELERFKVQAKAHSYKVIDALAARRGWDMQDKINWQHTLLTRWEREFRRGRASGKIPPAKIGPTRLKYF